MIFFRTNIPTMRRFPSFIFRSKTLFGTTFRKFNTTFNMYAVDKDIVASLERLALVDFSTTAGIERLEQSIKFADKLVEVDTSSVEPLISTVYYRNENLQRDEVLDKSYRKELMAAAPISEEFYYVAPFGTFTKKRETT